MIPKQWKVGKRVLTPGVYEDADGALHIDLVEVCLELGVMPTPENQRIAENAWRELNPGAFQKVVLNGK